MGIFKLTPSISRAQYIAEGRRLGDQMAEPETVIVVSDLHLGMGQDTATGRFDRRENFFADETFAQFLRHYDRGNGRRLLVLNGDTFDFLRITEIPRTDEDFLLWSKRLKELDAERSLKDLRRIRWREKRFGLRTDDYRSVWKLMLIERGHPGFFDALGEWIASGNSIVCVTGNHDVELHWPLVRTAIRAIVVRNPAHPGNGTLRFTDDNMRLANVYLEHGHRFDPVTAVQGDPVLPGSTELRLPLGSFVNRYVINKLEDLELFLANTKPVQSLLWGLIKRHPLRIFEIAWYAIPFLRRAARPYWLKDGLGFALFFGSILLPVATIGVAAAMFFVPAFAAWVRDLLNGRHVPIGIATMLAPYLIGVVRDIMPQRKCRVGDDRYAEGVYGALVDAGSGSYSRWYALLGHTHAPDVQYLPRIEGVPVFYVNSGTWAPRWERTRPDLLGRVVHTYIELTLVNGEYRHRLLEWTAWGSHSSAFLLKPQVLGESTAVAARSYIAEPRGMRISGGNKP